MSPLASFPAALKRIFGAERGARRQVTDRVYDQIVAAARQPMFYASWGVPDTPLGRYEMIALHLFLMLHRLRGEEGAAAALSQELTDAFFADLDHSIRELGVGDLGVPKRMKKLARMFYGRAAAYGEALEAGDPVRLSQALARNVRPDDAAWAQAGQLAYHVLSTHRALSRQSLSDIISGSVVFPAPQLA